MFNKAHMGWAISAAIVVCATKKVCASSGKEKKEVYGMDGGNRVPGE